MAFVVVVVVVFVVVVAAIVVVGNIREKQATATAAAGMFRSGDGTKATARCFPGNSRRRGHNLKCFAEGDFAKVAVVTARIAIQIQGRPQPQHQQQPQLSPNTPIIRFTRHLLLFPALFFVVG